MRVQLEMKLHEYQGLVNNQLRDYVVLGIPSEAMETCKYKLLNNSINVKNAGIKICIFILLK